MQMHDLFKDGEVWSVSFDLVTGEQIEILFRSPRVAEIVNKLLSDALEARFV